MILRLSLRSIRLLHFLRATVNQIGENPKFLENIYKGLMIEVLSLSSYHFYMIMIFAQGLKSVLASVFFPVDADITTKK